MRRTLHLNRVIISKLRLSAFIVAGLVLAGCQSENPMDYLPQATGGYVGMNMTAMRESAGLKRLTDEMEKMQAGTGDFTSDKAQKVYLAFDIPANAGTAPPIYGMALGTPGFADEVVQRYKANGATEGKMAGHDTYTSGPVTVSPVGNSGIMVFQNTAMLEKMVAVSKKKEPGARASSEFAYVDSKLNDYALVTAGTAQPLITMASPLLTTLEATNPKAVAAIKQVSMISMAFNWDTRPVIELMLHVADKAQADVLAGTVNGYLTMAKYAPMLASNPDVGKVLSPLKATAAEDGVKLVIEIPADVADRLFDQMQNMPSGMRSKPPEMLHRE